MRSRSPRERSSQRVRIGERIWTLLGHSMLGIIVIFLLAPAIMVVILSFSNADYISFPPPTWGLRQYRTLFEATLWLDAIWLSIRIAVPAALLSLLIAVPAVYAFYRTPIPASELLSFLGLTSLILPISAYAVALYGLYVSLGILGSFGGIVLAHTVLSFPLALVVIGAAMSRIPRDYELVAMTLGASRFRAWVGITGRLLTPALVAGFLFAFLMSFDEAVFINFLGGPGLVTLPKAIFDSVRFGVDPVITAIATVLMVVSAGVVAIAVWMEQRT